MIFTMEVVAMSIHKEDYRTNRADYLIAKRPDLVEKIKPKKKILRSDDQRSAKLLDDSSSLSVGPTSRRWKS
ncbi:hypothetical protein X773_31055 [Mesorhizobium sp. LSJC285A00]|nr:hypothetical protein X773_31055 [Mesorhizobium sp. LSJC285A00]